MRGETERHPLHSVTMDPIGSQFIGDSESLAYILKDNVMYQLYTLVARLMSTTKAAIALCGAVANRQTRNSLRFPPLVWSQYFELIYSMRIILYQNYC